MHFESELLDNGQRIKLCFNSFYAITNAVRRTTYVFNPYEVYCLCILCILLILKPIPATKIHLLQSVCVSAHAHAHTERFMCVRECYRQLQSRIYEFSANTKADDSFTENR